jgi:hypothetical protein
MATLTVTIDPELLEAAKRTAELRKTTPRPACLRISRLYLQHLNTRKPPKTY